MLGRVILFIAAVALGVVAYFGFRAGRVVGGLAAVVACFFGIGFLFAALLPERHYPLLAYWFETMRQALKYGWR